MDGKTIIRIYRDKEGKLSYNTFFDGEPIGWEVIGALEVVKDQVLEMFTAARNLSRDEVDEARGLLDDEEGK